jgi:hypothetical protein
MTCDDLRWIGDVLAAAESRQRLDRNAQLGELQRRPGCPSVVASQNAALQPQTITVNVAVGAAADHKQLGEVIQKALDAGRMAGKVRNESSVTVSYV